MYDVIVVGARCAGAPTALLLARQGHKVLLIDRGRFPSDTLSTLYIHQPGVARLAAWGALPRVIATGCPPLSTVELTVGGIRVTGSSRPVEGQASAYAPRRHVLDQVLVEAAVAAGAEFRDQTSATDVLFDSGRAAGIECRTVGTAAVKERARLVIGADGMRSRVAHRVRAETLESTDPQTCAYYTYWNIPGVRMAMYKAPGRLIGAVSTNAGATLVACYFPQREFQRIRRGAFDAYLDSIRQHAPELYEHIASRSPVDRMYGTGSQENFVRRAAGPGWALVGDAALQKDSLTAWGISDAFRQAQLLADSLGGALSDTERLDKGLRRYAESHMEQLIGGYRRTVYATGLKVEREQLDLMRAATESAEIRELFFSTMSGACEPQELWQLLHPAEADKPSLADP